MNLEDELSKLRVFKKNSVYRIGDLLLHSGLRWHIDRHEVIFNQKYKNTLLHKYFHHFKVDQHMWNLNMLRYSSQAASKLSTYNKKNTFSDFKFITNQHQITIPESDLLIHIRCGDIVSPKCKAYKNCHLHHADKLIDLISKKIHSGIKKIVIIAVMHYGSDSLRLNRYFWTQKKHDTNIKLLNELFTSISNTFGIPIVVDSKNCTDLQFIDYQFLKLIHAKNVIFDESGFSKVIEKIRES